MIEWFLLSHSVRMEKRARHVKYVKTQRDQKRPRVDSMPPWLDGRWHCYPEHGLQPGSAGLAFVGQQKTKPNQTKTHAPNKQENTTTNKIM